MKILFLGDSITEDGGYIRFVESKLNCETVNYGVGGTRIARQTFIYNNDNLMRNYDFRLRAQIMEEDADLVFVLGGTNDYRSGNCVLGDVHSRTPKTFCNELRLLVEDLCEKYGKEKLCFMLPPPRFDEDGFPCKGENGEQMGAKFSEYVNSIQQILTEYDIDIIDLYNDSIPRTLVDTGDEYMKDGVHPNEKGHKIIGEKICEYIKRRNCR